jgi:hypothetical protein
MTKPPLPFSLSHGGRGAEVRAFTVGRGEGIVRGARSNPGRSRHGDRGNRPYSFEDRQNITGKPEMQVIFFAFIERKKTARRNTGSQGRVLSGSGEGTPAG